MILDILRNLKPIVEPTAGKILENVAKNYVLDKCMDSDIKSTIINESTELAANVISYGIQNTLSDSTRNNNGYNDLYELACAQKFDRTF